MLEGSPSVSGKPGRLITLGGISLFSIWNELSTWKSTSVIKWRGKRGFTQARSTWYLFQSMMKAPICPSSLWQHWGTLSFRSNLGCVTCPGHHLKGFHPSLISIRTWHLSLKIICTLSRSLLVHSSRPWPDSSLWWCGSLLCCSLP